MNAGLRARILAETRQTPAPTRGEHARRVAIVVGVGTLATAALFFAMGGFKMGPRPAELVAFTAGLALLAAVALTRISGTPNGSMLPRPGAVLFVACLVAAPLLAVCALAASAIWPAATTEDVPMRTHVACAAMTLVQGALPLLVLLVPRRGTDPVHPAITGAALGMAAGAWAATMAYLRCPHASPLHSVVAHVGPTIALMVIGALLGRALLRLR
jgi:hypothetical protein